MLTSAYFLYRFSTRILFTGNGNGTQLEIAIDQGEIKANNAKTPICEVEFELKSGKVADMLNFVQHFLFFRWHAIRASQ